MTKTSKTKAAGRVALAAAVCAAVAIPAAPAYAERVQASDNLRWALDDGTSHDQPLGRKAYPAKAAGEL